MTERLKIPCDHCQRMTVVPAESLALLRREPSVEEVARVIDPWAFRSWQGLYDCCITHGDSEQDARKYADSTYKDDCDRALAKAQAVAALWGRDFGSLAPLVPAEPGATDSGSRRDG